MSLVLAGCAVVFLSTLAFWRRNTVLFMLAAGASMMVGLQWYPVYRTENGLGISLMLIAYAFLCFGFAYRYIFWGEKTDSD